MVAITEVELKHKLIQADVHVFHAMDLRGTAQYLTNGGILCRSRLMEVDPEYTQFWSDGEDERRGVLSRVFGNLYDFGAIFARASVSVTPNIYGPITFKFAPQVFHQVHDMVLTKESIASLSDPWRKHAISDQATVMEMLGGDKFGDPLAPAYQYTELSCANHVIPFTSLEQIIVDPLVINGIQLVDHVKTLASEAGVGHLVQPRHFRRAQNLARIQTVVDSLVSYQPEPERQPKGLKFADIPDWVADGDPWVQSRLEMWLSYFYNGTICYVREKQRSHQL